MSILGYGEDFLTLWLVTEKLDEIIKDETNLEDAIVFYRPSFGRRGKSDNKISSQFGEFDAIVISDRTTYLIESKWDGTLRNASNAEKVVLPDHQVERHQILEWYIRNWKPEDWEKHTQNKINDFKNRFRNNVIAPKGSRLRQNLKTVLNQIRSGTDVRHLIVYFSKNGFPEIKKNYGDIVFEERKIKYRPALDNYIKLFSSKK